MPRESRNSRLVKLRVLAIEALLQVLVRRVDAGVVEERHQRDRQDDHRERQAEVELHEPHAVVVALSGRADHRDGAQLRRHHRDAGGPPRDAALGEEVAVELVAVLGPPQAVEDDPGEKRRAGASSRSSARRRLQSSMPAMVAVTKLANVPASIARTPRRARSWRRSGASAPMPPIWMPIELKLAKPQSA